MIVSRDPRRSTLLRHRLPRSCRGDVKSVTATPLDSAFTTCDARKSFRIRFCENTGVSVGLFNVPTFKRSNVPTFSDLSLFVSHSSKLFCTLKKLNPFLFKQIRTLSRKHPGVGVPTLFAPRIKRNQAGTNSSSANDAGCRFPRHSTRSAASPPAGFTSQPFRFLVNYSGSILPVTGPAGHFLHCPQRPRSFV